MKIAHLLPYSACFPLESHNGRYEWVLRLAIAQAEIGHEVVLYSNPKSRVTGSKIQFRSINVDAGDHTLNNILLISQAFQDTTIDVFHSGFDFLHAVLAPRTKKPVVYTLHWDTTKTIARFLTEFSSVNCRAIPTTRYQFEQNQALGIASYPFIYHGIDLENFPFEPEPKTDRFIFIGRIAQHKGVREAIHIAQRANVGLDIIGKVAEKDTLYWEEIAPEIDGKQIRYLGPKTQHEVAGFMANAKAFLFPAQHVESFGQTVLESQASGTPVLTFDRGAMAELIEHNKTGFLAKDEEELLKYVREVDSLKRDNCRIQAEKFSFEKMVAAYEKLYSEF